MSEQEFKSVYFVDDAKEDAKGRSVTISFSENDVYLKRKIDSFSNEEIRQLIGISNYTELLNKAEKELRTVSQYIKFEISKNFSRSAQIKPADVTFQNSKAIPFQRWFPYVEGYSPDFVNGLLDKYCENAKNIYDPFSGTGTTFFAADTKGMHSYYSEINPILVFFSEIKIQILKLSSEGRNALSQKLLDEESKISQELDKVEEDFRLKSNYPGLFGESKYFDDKTFSRILKLRSYIDQIAESDHLLSNTLAIAVTSILLKVSAMKKVGDVRFKTEIELLRETYSLKDELGIKIKEIAEDISDFGYTLNDYPEFLLYNSKKLSLLRNISIDAVITSPPYLNGTNYLRNTKIELWFLRYIQYPNDLRGLRDQIVTSGINDVKARNGESLKEINKFKSAILEEALRELNERTYDKRIPIMVDSYFNEMFSVFDGLRKHLTKDAKVLIDIGDSIFADVHIKTDEILIDMMRGLGYELFEKLTLRKRRSRNQKILSQVLLAFNYKDYKRINKLNSAVNFGWEKEWNSFKKDMPHQQLPYSKKNWGNPNHSICSYGGKLKPAIAHSLVNTFVPENGIFFDPFIGVGTIPFEGALNGRKSYGMDISLPAFYISTAKVSKCESNIAHAYLDKIRQYILKNQLTDEVADAHGKFGFNKTISDYFEKNTLKEILLARRFLKEHHPTNPSEMLVIACLLHILHGNRPYALSRRSHPITPYAPTGIFEYKNVYEKVKTKLDKTLSEALPNNFCEGKVFLHDSTEVWPQEINNLDAIITSPPFFDSTRFYLANWMRIWFSGWEAKDFKHKPNLYVEERQKDSFSVYDNIFRQSRERLKKNGVLVFHLGKSVKCNMAEKIIERSSKYFTKYDLFDESVQHCQSHGIRDKGTVTSHQYLILH